MTSPQSSVLALVMLLLAAPCFAQTAPYTESGPYQSPLYTAPKQDPLDKSFGLPRFGMPGAELPQQRTTTLPAGNAAPGGLTALGQAPDAQTANKNTAGGQAGSVPNFFKPSTDFPLPPAAAAPNGMPSTESETPLYTTNQGMTTGVGTSSIFALPNPAGTAEAASIPTTDDTPLFTTNQSANTDDVDSQFITK